MALTWQQLDMQAASAAGQVTAAQTGRVASDDAKLIANAIVQAGSQIAMAIIMSAGSKQSS